MKIRLPIARKLFFSHFLAVILVSGSIGTYFYINAIDSLKNNLQARLQNSAALISELVDARELAGIQSEKDQNLPAYQHYLKLLRELRNTNPDVAYLYIMRKEGDRVEFVLDTDETAVQAMPGREYTSVVPALLLGFSGPSVDDQIFVDEWGSFMSGYAPLKNSQGMYLVGMDMRADEVQQKLRRVRISGIISLVFSIMLALAFSRFLSIHFTTPIKLLISRCSAIAEGRPNQHIALETGDELDNLIAAFNRMSSQLEESRVRHEQSQEALKQAKEELELRVEERTRDLLELTGKLKFEIIERQKVEEALAQAAMLDPLTNLLNRRAMNLHLRHELERFKRTGSTFSMLLCDIDHFKCINDELGHAVGDQVLITVSNMLQSAIRGQDFLSRWGGEEFLLLLPDTDLEGGAEAAEKLRRTLAAETIPVADRQIRLTISIGVCSYHNEHTLDSLISAADKALYLAKHQGRNRVVACG
ncbi:MAG: diguanylate cyclase [Desulforhabdus sp.]|nr:diguanylate cyclase [Desulforhabdus sp.]